MTRAALTLAVLAALWPGAAANAEGAEDLLNSLIEGGPGPDADHPSGIGPRSPEPAAGTDPDGGAAPATRAAPDTAAGPAPEREAYPVTEEAVSAIRVIVGRPLPGETCRDALFEARPLVRTRLEAEAGTTLKVPLADLCLMEFRNDAVDRSLELRVGQDLATLAITADARLFSGLTLAPNQLTTVALRDLPVGRLELSVDVHWSAGPGRREVQTFRLVLIDT